MKNSKFKFLRQVFIMLGVVSILAVSCKKDDDPVVADVIASFQYSVNATNYLEVTFTNYSQHATSYSWNFGDGSEVSTEANPTHTYTATGDYTVTLTATNSAGTINFSETLTITDPLEAMKLLTGEVSKTWKLYRVGTCMSMGQNEGNPASEWPGLTNNGARPILYNQTFTFHADGKYVFDDNGWFWGEWGVFPEEKAYEAIPANMLNQDGTDVSAWLGGTTHAFTYDPVAGTATITGMGAFIGICKLGTSDYTTIPMVSTTFNLTITQETGYDLMKVVFNYGEYAYWPITYVSYSDPSLEPELVTESAPFGEDLADITPSSMKITFASRDAADMVVLDTITSNSNIVFGVTDPAGGGTLVGQFNRTDQNYQEQQFQTAPDKMDIQFDNLTTVTFDVYFPSSNDYSGTLTKTVEVGFGDISETEAGWWTDIVGQLVDDGTSVTLDAWNSYSFNLTDAKTRADLDMFYINIGASAHTATGTFYIRNLSFQ